MVNSKADKTGGHKSTGAKTASYSSKPVPYSAPAPAASGLVVAGQKALAARAKKELSPLADPSQSITE